MIFAAILCGMALDTVFDKAEPRVKAPGRQIVGDDEQLQQLDMLARVANDRFDQHPTYSHGAVLRADVHPPQDALVRVLWPRLNVKAGSAHELRTAECSDDEVVGQAPSKRLERAVLLDL